MKFITVVVFIILLMGVLSPVALAEDQADSDLQQVDSNAQAFGVASAQSQFTNPLTGMPTSANIANNRPIAVSFNNARAALPQHGISQADIIYEMLIEGGVTRMLALFQDISRVGNIGSIRSMRPYMHFIGYGYNAIYAHAGGSPEAMALLANFNRLCGVFGPGADAFFRNPIPGRAFEHTLFTTGARVNQGINNLGFNRLQRPGDVRGPAFSADATPQDGKPATGVDVRFSSASTTRFNFCPVSNRYHVTLHGNVPYVDGNNNARVAVTNILILQMRVTGTDYAGRLQMETAEWNRGYFVNGGRAVEISWRREQVRYQFEYNLYPCGTPLVLGQGKTYICIVPDIRQIRFSGVESDLQPPTTTPPSTQQPTLPATNATTVHNGINYALVYHFEWYMARYPDLNAVFGNNPNAAIAHFVNHGMREGRQAHPDFNVHYYRNANPDLRVAFGNDLRAYFTHFVNHGNRENRAFSPVLTSPIAVRNNVNFALVYNMNTYLELNPDIYAAFGNDEVAVLAHFVNHGMREGRQAHPDFNVHYYRNANPDLRVVFGNDLRAYFMHFINHGHREDRQFSPELTNPITVRNNVNFAPVYDMNTYLELNPDIYATFGNDDVAVLAHFVNHGMREGRVAHSDFNIHAYRELNPDLAAAFGNDLRASFMHFINHGNREGRSATH